MWKSVESYSTLFHMFCVISKIKKSLYLLFKLVGIIIRAFIISCLSILLVKKICDKDFCGTGFVVCIYGNNISFDKIKG